MAMTILNAIKFTASSFRKYAGAAGRSLNKRPVILAFTNWEGNRSYGWNDDDDEKSTITYSVLTADRVPEAAELFSTQFATFEPMNMALGLPKSQVSRWAPNYITDVIQHKASWMAIEDKTNKLCGVSLNAIMPNPKDRPLNLTKYIDRNSEPIMGQITSFLEALCEGHSAPGVSDTDRVLDSHIVCVSKKYSDKGVASILFMKAEEYAFRTIGIKTFYGYATSIYSSRALQKMGYSTLREIKFADYKDKETGEKIFAKANMGPNVHARFVCKTRTK